MTAIVEVVAREILDSRGNPTIEADVLVESSGQSEVGEIYMLIRVEQHVGRLDVPMDKTLRVRRIQGVRHLATHGERPALVERPFRVEDRP